MKRSTSSRQGGPVSPYSAYSLRTTLAAATAMLGALFALIVAVSYPVVAIGVVTAVATGVAARSVYRRLATRRREGRTRRVCIPATEVCLEA